MTSQTHRNRTVKKTLSRRQFLRIVGVAGTAAGVGFMFDRSSTQQMAISETRLLMGTIVNLTIISDAPDTTRSVIAQTLDHMATLESVLSRFVATSQVSRLNRDGSLSQPSPHLLTILDQSEQISKQSRGAFDITVKPLIDLYQEHTSIGYLPTDEEIQRTLTKVDHRALQFTEEKIELLRPGMAITLDGIAKGYVVDAGVRVLRQSGYTNVLVEAGGDLLALGHKADKSTWQIGIHSPRETHEGVLAKIGVHNQAVATSGDYMQTFTSDFAHHHIVDPRTGYSSSELSSVTTTSPTVMMADALATAVMVLGVTEGLSLIENTPGCEALLVTKDLQTVRSSGF